MTPTDPALSHFALLLIAALAVGCPGTSPPGDDGYTTGGDDDVGDDDDSEDDDSTEDDDASGDDDSAGGDDDTGDDDTTGDDDSVPLTVALADTGSSGVDEIDDILTAEGHVVDPIDLADLVVQLGPSHDLLVYPGSSDGVLAVLTQPGLGAAIRDFVDAGGGYVGICGGAIAGSNDLIYDGLLLPNAMIGLLDVEATWYLDWNAYVGNMAELQFEVAAQHEILAGLSVGDGMAGDYAGGPTLESATADVPLRYAEDLDPALAGHGVTGMGALAVGEHGAGRVVLSAIHPEYNHAPLLLSYVTWVGPDGR